MQKFYFPFALSPKTKSMWRLRLYSGAVIQALTRVAEIVAIKLIVDAVEHKHNLMRTGFIFLALYGGAHVVKALAQVDKVQCAEGISRMTHRAEAAISWSRAHLVEQHLVISSILTAVMICMFSAYYSVQSGIVFSVFLMASLGVSTIYARSFRSYHNYAQSTVSSYERVRKRIVSVNIISTLVHMLGMPLFAYVAWLTLYGHVTLGNGVVLFLAAKLLISAASSIVSPLMRMARALSQIDLTQKKATKIK